MGGRSGRGEESDLRLVELKMGPGRGGRLEASSFDVRTLVRDLLRAGRCGIGGGEEEDSLEGSSHSDARFSFAPELVLERILLLNVEGSRRSGRTELPTTGTRFENGASGGRRNDELDDIECEDVDLD